MALDTTLRTTHALPCDSPQEPLTLIAVCRCSRCPHLEVMWCGARYGVDKSLQGLLVDMIFLQKEEDLFLKVLIQGNKNKNKNLISYKDVLMLKGRWSHNHENCVTGKFLKPTISKMQSRSFFPPRILTSSSSLIDDRAAIADAIPAFLAWTRD